MPQARLLLYAAALALFALLPAQVRAHPSAGITWFDAEAEVTTADECVSNAERVERALGLYYGLGVVAIVAVAGLKELTRRTGHA